jgi:uncharacterized membrane protein
VEAFPQRNLAMALPPNSDDVQKEAPVESKAKILGHPIHPMLIVFPLGLFITAIVFDIIYLVTDNGKWTEIAYWMIAAGIIGGLAAAIFGLIDWLAIPGGTRAKSIGLLHGAGNVVVVALFGLSWLLRRDEPRDPALIALVLSFVGIGIGTVTGWLGGELVGRLGVGVDEGAHLDAPSSLSGQPAESRAPEHAPRVS